MAVMNKEHGQYQYTPLPSSRSIRILSIYRTSVYVDDELFMSNNRWSKLEHNQDVGAFAFSLEVVDLDSIRPYEAVSYVWGDHKRDLPLQLDDGRQLLVSESVLRALPSWTSASSTGRLWIDQICIDQDSLEERATQVRMMGDIYSKCAKVLIFLACKDIWLEYPANGSPYQALLKMITGVAAKSRQTGVHCSQVLDDTMGQSKPGNSDFQDVEFFVNALMHILGRHPWFRRAWIVQEAVFPPEALFLIERDSCSTADIAFAFEDLTRMVLTSMRWQVANSDHVAQASHTFITSFPSRLYSIGNRRRARSHSDGSFLSVLDDLGPAAECSIELDLVYSLLAFAGDEFRDLVPNYRLPVEEVLTELTIMSIDANRSLAVLAYADRYYSRKGCPSWVPDWRSTSRVAAYMCKPDTQCEFFAAGSRQYDACLGDPHMKSLPVSGKMIDSIVSIGPKFGSKHLKGLSGTAFQEELDLETFEHELKKDMNSRHHFRDIQHRIFRAIVLACLRERDQKKAVDRLYRQLYKDGSPDDDSETQHMLGEFSDRTHRLMDHCLCLTARGQVGFVTTAAIVGDRVSILHGSAVPLILRETENLGTFEFVCQAYVEGIMYGEAVDWEVSEASQYILI